MSRNRGQADRRAEVARGRGRKPCRKTGRWSSEEEANAALRETMGTSARPKVPALAYPCRRHGGRVWWHLSSSHPSRRSGVAL